MRAHKPTHKATRRDGRGEEAGPAAAGLLGEPVRAALPDRAGREGPLLRVPRAGPREQERAPAPRQPGPQEDPRAPPRRPPRLRVPHHRAVPGRGVPGDAVAAPRRRRRRVRARAGQVLGGLRGQEALRLRHPAVEAQGGRPLAGADGDGRDPPHAGGRARRRRVLRRGGVRVRRRRARAVHVVVPRLRAVRGPQRREGVPQARRVGQAMRGAA